MEVILALAILTGTIAVLGEAVRLAIRNAQVAQATTQAQLLCESKLAEITTGITPLESVQGVPFATTGSSDQPEWMSEWLYSISWDQTDHEGLNLVCVTVAQDLPPEKRPVTLSLFRWIPDSGIEISATTDSESFGSGGSSG